MIMVDQLVTTSKCLSKLMVTTAESIISLNARNNHLFVRYQCDIIINHTVSWFDNIVYNTNFNDLLIINLALLQ